MAARKSSRIRQRSGSRAQIGRACSGSSSDGSGMSLTEEFVAVYRMQPLLPGDDVFRSRRATPSSRSGRPRDRGYAVLRAAREERRMAPCLYSLGARIPARSRCTTTHASCSSSSARTASPSASRPPTSCASVSAASSATNEFRCLFHRKPVRSFEELNPEHAEEVDRIHGDIDWLDLMIGLT